MEDELLSEILATEREIRLRIDALKRRNAERLEALRRELDEMLEGEARALQGELERARAKAEQAARLEADARLAEAGAFALRLEKLDAVELDRVVLRHLARIRPEGADDRQDEQA